MEEEHQPNLTQPVTKAPKKQNNLRGILIIILLIASIVATVYINYKPEGNESISQADPSLLLGSGNPVVATVELYAAISYETASPIVTMINEYKEQDNIKGLIVRINSPGGTVAATQEIYNAIKAFAAAKKPVFCAIADIAASGGYYSACGCQKIIANPGSLVGSVGVILGGYNFKGLFDKLGIKDQTIKSGRFKDILSTARDMTEEEKKFLQDMVDKTYSQFINTVLENRPKVQEHKEKNDDVFDKISNAGVFTGTVAHEMGLVDELGDFELAKKLMKEELKANDITLLEPKQDFLKSLIESFLGGKFNYRFPVSEPLLLEDFFRRQNVPLAYLAGFWR